MFTSQLRRTFATSASTSPTHYQVLQLPPSASIKEIKLQFKKLLKQYHPDLNQHLDDASKESNAAKFTLMVQAYDVLKDVKRKRAYDQSLRPNGSSSAYSSPRNRGEYNKYHGDAKYYSRHGFNSSTNGGSGYSSYTALGLNTKRHKVRFHNHKHPQDGDPNMSTFSGQHVNYGDKYDVPHFDYDHHLMRNLMFEQRIIDKHLDQSTKDKILSQLMKLGQKVDEGLKTKHLLRHVNMIKGETNAANAANGVGGSGENSNSASYNSSGQSYYGNRGYLPRKDSNYSNAKYGGSYTYTGANTYENLYQKPSNHDLSGGMARAVALIGGTLSVYVVYKLIF